MSTTTQSNPVLPEVPTVSPINQAAKFRDLRLRVLSGLEAIRKLSLLNEETEDDQEGAILVSDLAQFALNDFKELKSLLED